jgi:hypothetical protein
VRHSTRGVGDEQKPPNILRAAYLSIPNWVTVQAAPVRPQTLFIDRAVTYIYKNIGGTELRLHVFNPPNHTSSMRQPAFCFF